MIEKLLQETQNSLRASPRIILIASILGYLISNKPIAIRFIIYFLITSLISPILKLFFGTFMPGFNYIYRPKGGGRGTGCGVYAKTNSGYVEVGEKVGMPSGHSLEAMMAATFWALKIWNEKESTKTSKLVRILSLFVLSISVVASRTYLMENCHTISQTVMGSILGILAGYLFYKLDDNFK